MVQPSLSATLTTFGVLLCWHGGCNPPPQGLAPLELLVILLLIACATDPAAPPKPAADTPALVSAIDVEEVCARGESEDDPERGDANHDGRVDLADAVWILRYLNEGGDPPACLDAMEIVEDGGLDLGDGFGILHHLYAGSSLPGSNTLRCGRLERLPDPKCGEMGMGIEAPARVSGSFEAHLSLVSEDLDVQGWSVGVSAEGCTIAGTSLAGTVAADRRVDPAGKRDKGYQRGDLVEGGVTHATLLSWQKEVTLESSKDAARILTISVDATPPASGCAACTLRLSDDLQGPGERVRLGLVAGGRTYPIDPVSVEVEVCAG